MTIMQGRRSTLHGVWGGVVIGIYIQLDDLHVGTIQEIQCVFIHPVSEMVNQADNAGVDQGFGAVDAREMGDITGAVPG